MRRTRRRLKFHKDRRIDDLVAIVCKQLQPPLVNQCDMHRVQVIRVALCVAIFVAILDASVGDTRLPLTCKNIARDVIMYSCKGSRIDQTRYRESGYGAGEGRGNSR